MTWSPGLEGAPKDGTMILAVVDGVPEVIFWHVCGYHWDVESEGGTQEFNAKLLACRNQVLEETGREFVSVFELKDDSNYVVSEGFWFSIPRWWSSHHSWADFGIHPSQVSKWAYFSPTRKVPLGLCGKCDASAWWSETSERMGVCDGCGSETGIHTPSQDYVKKQFPDFKEWRREQR